MAEPIRMVGTGPLTITLPTPKLAGEEVIVYGPQGELARFQAEIIVGERGRARLHWMVRGPTEEVEAP
jgi:hypothetical protein